VRIWQESLLPGEIPGLYAPLVQGASFCLEQIMEQVKKEEIIDGSKAFAKQQKALREIHTKNRKSVAILNAKRSAALARIIQLRRWVMAGFTPSWRFQQEV
jgi:hypothetical protein